MRTNLISEWSVGEYLGQLILIERSETDVQIALKVVSNSHHGVIQFWWDESDYLIQGITEVLITKHDKLSANMLVGLMLSKNDNILFGWSPINDDQCGLVLYQDNESIIIDEANVVNFFRWLRSNLQLIGRIVS